MIKYTIPGIHGTENYGIYRIRCGNEYRYQVCWGKNLVPFHTAPNMKKAEEAIRQCAEYKLNLEYHSALYNNLVPDLPIQSLKHSMRNYRVTRFKTYLAWLVTGIRIVRSLT